MRIQTSTYADFKLAIANATGPGVTAVYGVDQTSSGGPFYAYTIGWSSGAWLIIEVKLDAKPATWAADIGTTIWFNSPLEFSEFV